MTKSGPQKQLALLATWLLLAAFGQTGPAGAGSSTAAGLDIVFASDRRGGFEIWTMQADGKSPRAITDHTVVPRDEYRPSPSPDGRAIAITTYRFGGWKLGLLKNGDVARLTDGARFRGRLYEASASWSPDGRYVAFLQYHHRPGLHVMDLETGKSRLLVAETRYYDLAFPSWTPDSASILYSDRTQGNYDLYTINIINGDSSRLTDTPHDELAAAFSPDQSKIAVFSNEPGRFQLFTVDIEDDNGKQLTNSPDHVRVYDIEDDRGWYISSPAWSQDGKFILHAASRNNNIDLYLTNAESGSTRRLTTQPGLDVHPSWIKHTQ